MARRGQCRLELASFSIVSSGIEVDALLSSRETTPRRAPKHDPVDPARARRLADVLGDEV